MRLSGIFVSVLFILLTAKTSVAAATLITDRRTVEEFSELNWKGAAKVDPTDQDGWCEISSPQSKPLQDGLKLVLTNKGTVLVYIKGPDLRPMAGLGLLSGDTRSAAPIFGLPVTAHLTVWTGAVGSSPSKSFNYNASLDSGISWPSTLQIKITTTMTDGLMNSIVKSDILVATVNGQKFLSVIELTAAPAAWEAVKSCVHKHWNVQW